MMTTVTHKDEPKFLNQVKKNKICRQNIPKATENKKKRARDTLQLCFEVNHQLFEAKKR